MKYPLKQKNSKEKKSLNSAVALFSLWIIDNTNEVIKMNRDFTKKNNENCSVERQKKIPKSEH